MTNTAKGHKGFIAKPAGERFAALVQVGSIDECWVWQGGTDKYGYGLFRLGGKMVQAHRASYEMVNGPIATGLNILHSCDNPPCVNPEHLSAGTQKQNIEDSVAKGRWGSRPRKAKA